MREVPGERSRSNVQVWGRSADPLPEDGRLTADHVAQALRAARELLGMQIGWIAEFRDGRQVFQTVEGDGPAFGLAEGASMPLDSSYCVRMVRGDIPNAIPDTSVEPAVRDMEATKAADIRSYVGVPIELGDGTVFGTLCCASRRPTGHVSEHDLNFLRGIARRVARQIEDLRAEWVRVDPAIEDP